MSSPGYGSIGNNGSGSNNNHNRDNSLHKRSSFFGGHKPSLEDSRPSTSNTAAGTEDYFQTGLGGGEGATTTGAAVDEKTQRNTTHDPNDNDGIKKEENDMHHHGHQHEPGESCSVPHMMQSMLSDQQHDIVETVVIKVRDSADVTQKVKRSSLSIFHSLLPCSYYLPDICLQMDGRRYLHQTHFVFVYRRYFTFGTSGNCL